MHLQKRSYYVTRVAIFYEFVCYLYIIFVAFFFQNTLNTFFELIFFLFYNSFDVWDNSFFDIDFVYFFDVGHFAVFFWGDEGNCSSCLACSSCPSNSVGVSFCVLWYCIVDDVCHIVDINTSCCDICRYQNVYFFVFETLEKMFSLFLCEIAVETFCAISLVI